LSLATRSALAADGDLLSAEERAQIETLLAQLAATAAGTDADTIEASLKALALGTEAFAAERMNRGIRAAFTGRSVDDI